MPRKTRVFRVGFVRLKLRFNEAAARCRGKHRTLVGEADGGIASMRPRPDAAENAPHPDRRAAGGRASMRPRPDAAENAETHNVSRIPERLQ